jgi:hypothetical protein
MRLKYQRKMLKNIFTVSSLTRYHFSWDLAVLQHELHIYEFYQSDHTPTSVLKPLPHFQTLQQPILLISIAEEFTGHADGALWDTLYFTFGNLFLSTLASIQRHWNCWPSQSRVRFPFYHKRVEQCVSTVTSKSMYYIFHCQYEVIQVCLPVCKTVQGK